MSAESKKAERRRQMQSLLRELFQFDRADLDFGIYRILNARHDEIERFIEHDLIEAVEEGLAEFRTEARSKLQESVEAARRAVIENLGPAAIDSTGRVTQYAELPVARQYRAACRQLELAELADETEAHILNDLVTFFARYYDEGDFLTERRYSSREPKYAIPYNGEEVLLHWANRDQYYVKTTEHFTNYRFELAGFTICFRLVQANVPQDNIKGNKRYFVPRAEEPAIYDTDTRTLIIAFEYRPLSAVEEAHYVELYNAAQPRNGRRKSLDRRLLCAAVEQELLQAVTDAELRARLAAVPQEQATSALGCHLNRYTARNMMDYFVHKDLGGFLNRELDYYLKNEVLRVNDIIEDREGDITAHVMARLRVIRQIGRRVISFLAQIEDFQRRLFEKRKFVVQTDYCITLDRVPKAFYPEILATAAQLEE